MFLHNAVYSNRVDNVRQALEDPDVDPNLLNDAGRSPFMLACSKQNVEMVRLFLDTKRKVDYNQTCPDGYTAWYYSLHPHYGAVMRMLLADRRIDIGALSISGKNCFHWVNWDNDAIHTVKMILASDRPEIPRIVNLPDKENCVPRDFADMFREPLVVKLIDDYIRDAAGTRARLRMELGYPEYEAAELFATIVLLCDDYYEIKKDPHTEPSLLGYVWSACTIL